MKALIVDDEHPCRQTLKDLLHKYCAQVTEVRMASNISEGLQALEEARPDVLFLDVSMPDGTGFDLLAQVRDRDFPVIFTTAHDDYAVKAFRYSAIDYLLKPINITELREALAKCESQPGTHADQVAAAEAFMDQDEFDKVLVATADGYEFLDLKEIVAVSADGNYSSISLMGGRTVLVSRNIGEFEEMLQGMGFYRIHHSHLIHVRYLQTILKKDSQVVMKNGQRLLISSRRKAPFLKFCQQMGQF